jgi:protein TonB
LLLHGLIVWGLAVALLTQPAPLPIIVIQTHIEPREETPPPPPPPVPLVVPAMPSAHMPIIPQFESPPLPNAITQPPVSHHVAPAPPGPVEQPAPPAPPPDFLSRLYARINAAKRYPHAALSARIQGRPVVHFVMDRQGRVLSCVVAKSSGVPVLDAAAVAAVTDAQPLPALPPQIPGQTYSITVGINFSLNR